MPDWFDQNAPQQGDWFAQNTPQPAEQSQHPILSGIGAGIWRAIPKSIGEVFGMVSPAQSGVEELSRDVRFVGDVARGQPIEESLKKDLPDVAGQRAALRGEYGTREQAAEITGLGLQAAMLALPFAKGLRAKIPTISDTFRGVPKEVGAEAETAAKEVTADATQERQIQEDIQPKRPGDDAGRVPAEAGAGGGVQPTTEIQAQEVTPTVPQPEPPPELTLGEIPADAKATVNFSTAEGGQVTREMNAREAHGIFEKERSSYQALLDCLGA